MASSQTSKKSSQQKLREKNIKEVKMYYWSKVDQGDTNEVYKILSYAK
jgi:DNA-binding protein Fis